MSVFVTVGVAPQLVPARVGCDPWPTYTDAFPTWKGVAFRGIKSGAAQCRVAWRRIGREGFERTLCWLQTESCQFAIFNDDYQFFASTGVGTHRVSAFTHDTFSVYAIKFDVRRSLWLYMHLNFQAGIAIIGFKLRACEKSD